jgi:hypothetical protein
LSPSTWACLACFFLCPRFLIFMCNHCWGVCVCDQQRFVCDPWKRNLSQPWRWKDIDRSWSVTCFFSFFFLPKKMKNTDIFCFISACHQGQRRNVTMVGITRHPEIDFGSKPFPG